MNCRKIFDETETERFTKARLISEEMITDGHFDPI